MRQTGLHALVCLAVVAAFALALALRYTLCALLGGAVIGIAVRPLIEWGARLGLSRRAAGAVVFGFILVLALAGLVWLAPLAAGQLSSLGVRLPEMLTQLHGQLSVSPSRALRSLGSLLEPVLQSRIVSGDRPVLARAAGFMGDAVRSAYVVLLILVIAATLGDATSAARKLFVRVIPPALAPRLRELGAEADRKLGAYVRGQLVICGLSATIATIACFAFGLPYAVLLGLATGICEIVPLIGPVGIGLVVLLVSIVSVPHHAAWVALVFLLNHLSQTYLVTPRVMDKAIGVTPFAVLLSVVVFTALLGMPGAVLSIPLAAIVQLALDHFVHPTPASEEANA